MCFDLKPGEVHAVCGENGAGKSTLMKIVSGQYQPDGGSITYKGETRRFANSLDAERAGIAIIHQELNLIPHLSVAENIFLAREPKRGWFIDRAALRRNAQACLDRLGVDIQPDALVKNLSVAQCQMVEIAKALSLNAEILIMDEPTSSLKLATTSALFKRTAMDMDFNGGTIVDGGPSVGDAGAALFQLMLDTASGAPTRSEEHGMGDNEFVPWHLGAVM